MVVEFGIMSSRWSVEAPSRLVCYAAIIIYLGSGGYNTVVLYNDECKDDQWAFSGDLDKRLKEIFGEDFFAFADKHQDEIREALKTIEELV